MFLPATFLSQATAVVAVRSGVNVKIGVHLTPALILIVIVFRRDVGGLKLASESVECPRCDILSSGVQLILCCGCCCRCVCGFLVRPSFLCVICVWVIVPVDCRIVSTMNWLECGVRGWYTVVIVNTMLSCSVSSNLPVTDTHCRLLNVRRRLLETHGRLLATHGRLQTARRFRNPRILPLANSSKAVKEVNKAIRGGVVVPSVVFGDGLGRQRCWRKLTVLPFGLRWGRTSVFLTTWIGTLAAALLLWVGIGLNGRFRCSSFLRGLHGGGRVLRRGGRHGRYILS